MVLTFNFKDNDTNKQFSCELKCKRCAAIVKNGRQCGRTVCIGLPYCWYHLQQKEDIKIKEGRHGKGVFAWDKSNSNRRGAHVDNKTVFRAGDKITEYTGEKISKRQVDERYGPGDTVTAPYGLQLPDGKIEDGACKRGSGTIFNHSRYAREQKAKLSYSRKMEGNRYVYNGVIRATKPIKNGEEIFVNYGNDYRFGENTTHTTKNKYKAVHRVRRNRRR